MHLSDWIFGIPLETHTQSHETSDRTETWPGGSSEYEALQDEPTMTFEYDDKPCGSAYDREAAVKYAEKFAFRVCSDGFMMLEDAAGETTRGMPAVKMPADASIINDSFKTEHVVNADGNQFILEKTRVSLTNKQMDDCTHFISCCIGCPPGGKGGGIRVPTTMWGIPKTTIHTVSPACQQWSRF